MAAVYDPENTLNIKEMAEGLKKSLPSYARPLFVRVLSELPMTGKYFNSNGFICLVFVFTILVINI